MQCSERRSRHSKSRFNNRNRASTIEIALQHSTPKFNVLKSNFNVQKRNVNVRKTNLNVRKSNFRVRKSIFRVRKSNFRVLKTNFRVLEANLTLLKANFKVLKLEKAKILIVPFVSQVIQSINKIEIQKKIKCFKFSPHMHTGNSKIVAS